MSQFLSIAIVLFVSQAFAGLGEDFKKLKNSGSNYEVVGAICEDVAKLRYQEEFSSSTYEVVTGVEYGDGTRTIGELDVVVFEKLTGKVVRVTEVKCWKDLNGALVKAKSQRQRFITYLNSNKPIYFRFLHGQHDFQESDFLSVRDFRSMAQKGSKMAGFDGELPYELKELMQLRQMMIECQHKGLCSAPQH